MLRYALGRLLGAIPTLFVVLTLAFVLVRLAPGGPFDAARSLPAEVRSNLDRVYGLDRPLLEQYARWLGGLVRGDLGPSLSLHGYEVADLVAAGLPLSLALGILALLLAVGVGVPLGVLGALRRGTGLDRAVAGFAAIGVAVPVYVVAPLLALAFGVQLGWLPVGGWTGRPVELVLPAVALAWPTLAYVVRLTRAGVLDTLPLPHVRAARARGLTRGTVLARHVLPLALAPVLAWLGPAAAGILAGSLVVETVFGLPGIGRYLVDGALARDYTLVLGKVVVYAVLVLAANLAADLAHAALDPRVRRAGP